MISSNLVYVYFYKQHYKFCVHSAGFIQDLIFFWQGGINIAGRLGGTGAKVYMYMHYYTTFVLIFLMIHNILSQCKCVYFGSRLLLSLVCVLYMQYQSKSCLIESCSVCMITVVCKLTYYNSGTHESRKFSKICYQM